MDVWGCAPQVSESSISMSNEASGQQKTQELIHTSETEASSEESFLKIIYGGVSRCVSVVTVSVTYISCGAG